MKRKTALLAAVAAAAAPAVTAVTLQVVSVLGRDQVRENPDVDPIALKDSFRNALKAADGGWGDPAWAHCGKVKGVLVLQVLVPYRDRVVVAANRSVGVRRVSFWAPASGGPNPRKDGLLGEVVVSRGTARWEDPLLPSGLPRPASAADRTLFETLAVDVVGCLHYAVRNSAR
jgi:hypothetical protein